MTYKRSLAVAIAAAVTALVTMGCTRTLGEGDPDIQAAQTFDLHPLYWVGEHFEQWHLEHVRVSPGGFATFSYGTCEADWSQHSCSVPLQIQIQPLCAHLDAVARNPVWKRREVRSAPVGTIDGAPVLFTDRVQAKVYRGQGSDADLAMRALHALRSVNDVKPTIDATDPIPAAPRAVLSGAAPCRG